MEDIERKASDEGTTTSPTESQTTGPDTSHESVYRNRIERINELRVRSQLHSNPFSSALLAANADLFEVHVNVAETLRRANDAESLTIERIAEQSQAMDYLIRIPKAISQFAQIGNQITKAAERHRRS